MNTHLNAFKVNTIFVGYFSWYTLLLLWFEKQVGLKSLFCTPLMHAYYFGRSSVNFKRMFILTFINWPSSLFIMPYSYIFFQEHLSIQLDFSERLSIFS